MKNRKSKWQYTDCQRKNRYVQIFCHTHINRATSLTFSGPVHHPMEQLMYKFHFYISNGIAFIPPFVTYPNFCIPTMKEKVHFNSINLNTKKWYGIGNNCPRPPHDTLFYG